MQLNENFTTFQIYKLPDVGVNINSKNEMCISKQLIQDLMPIGLKLYAET